MTTNSAGSILTNRVTTPDTRGTTQFVCAGWAMSGNTPLSGTTNEFTMTVTNSAVLEWLWTTNFYLDLSTVGDGTIGGAASGWYPYGGSVVVTAMPNPGWVFDAWTGDTQGDPNNPVMTLTINGPIGLTVHFEALAEVPPVLGPVNDHIGYVSNLLTFDVNAYDDGGPSNNVTLSVTGLPASATFNVVGNLTNKTGTFSWTPPTNGVWPVMFTANDGLHWTSVLIRIYVTTSGATIVTNIVGKPVPGDEPHWGPEITNATPGNTNIVVDWKAEPGIPYAILVSPDYYFLGTAGTSLWWSLDQVITAVVDSLSAEIPFPADEDILYFQIVLAIQNDAEQMYAIVRIPIAQGLTMIAPPVVMDLSLTGAFGRALSGVLTGSATEPGAQAELSVWTNGPSGGGWRIFWLRDGVGWCETGQTTPTDFAVEPGKGVFVKNLQAPTNVVFVGEVGQWLWRTNRFFESYNLVTLSDGQFKNLQEQFANPSSGSVKGSSDFLNADLIYIMHYDMTWSVYQYVTGTGTPKDNKWMDVKTGQVIENPLLRPGMAYYYLRRAGQGLLDMPF